MYLGVDFGTSKLKASILDTAGVLRGSVSRLYDDRTESEPMHEWWYRSFRTVVEQLLLSTETVGRVESVAITATAPNVYMESAVDGKTIQFFEDTAYAVELELDELLGSPKWANEVLSKLLYLSRQWPADDGQRWFTTHNYLVYRLTGRYALDRAVWAECGSLCHDGDWNIALLERLGLGHLEMPELSYPLAAMGPLIDSSMSGLLGKNCVVVLGSSDSVGTVAGSGAFGLTDFLTYYGTFNSATRLLVSTDALLSESVTSTPFDWFCSLPRSGHQLDDLVRGLFGSGRYDEFFAAAAAAPPGSDGIQFIHTPLGASSTVSTSPRASIFNLPLNWTRESVARSFLEGYAFSIRAFASYEGVELHGLTARSAGGGSRSVVWRQIVSDIVDVPQTRCTGVDEGFGSALLAMGGVQGLDSIQSISRSRLASAVTTYPNHNFSSLYEEAYAAYLQVFGWGRSDPPL